MKSVSMPVNATSQKPFTKIKSYGHVSYGGTPK